MIIFIGLVLTVAGFIGFADRMHWFARNGREITLDKIVSIYLILFVGGLSLFAFGVKNLAESRINKNFTKGIDYSQVPVIGESESEAKIHIVHRDGKLLGIILVPRTTVKIK